ncbi:MAG: hypothetical protein GX846_05930, partial [Deltaproteobacteria bacterium]|nr:hypothetical protein [Deltaproteobacteria bacterium]
VYDCLYGRIKINLNFIKAAVEATGDPDIKAFLEPEGWALYEKPALGEITDNFEKEVNDIFLAVTHLSVSIKDAIKNRKLDRQKLAHLKRLRAEVARQTDEVMLFAEEIYSKKC